MILEDQYRVIMVNDGVACLNAVSFNRPDLVLLDVLMPKMGGDEVCYTLKKSPSFQSIPVILMSAMDLDEYHNIHGINLADAYLRKPIDSVELKNTIKSLLQ